MILKKMLQYVVKNPQYGMVGPRIIDETGEEETKPRYVYAGEKQLNYPYKDLPGKIAWLLGAAIILPRHVFEKIGGFDEDYFLYGDDLEIGLNVRQKGYEIGYCNQVTVLHIGGAHEVRENWYNRAMKKQKSLHIFYRKHYKPENQNFLVRREWRRAQYRKWIYRLLKLFHVKFRNKFDYYRAIVDSSKEFIQA